ncbi:hypothetical protein NQZ79_g3938 [Umbelopsis isabellina]|nr:hypothetical protein NQZ79_g3938 [Umbelopsis isabellina]
MSTTSIHTDSAKLEPSNVNLIFKVPESLIAPSSTLNPYQSPLTEENLQTHTIECPSSRETKAQLILCYVTMQQNILEAEAQLRENAQIQAQEMVPVEFPRDSELIRETMCEMNKTRLSLAHSIRNNASASSLGASRRRTTLLSNVIEAQEEEEEVWNEKSRIRRNKLLNIFERLSEPLKMLANSKSSKTGFVLSRNTSSQHRRRGQQFGVNEDYDSGISVTSPKSKRNSIGGFSYQKDKPHSKLGTSYRDSIDEFAAYRYPKMIPARLSTDQSLRRHSTTDISYLATAW